MKRMLLFTLDSATEQTYNGLTFRVSPYFGYSSEIILFSEREEYQK